MPQSSLNHENNRGVFALLKGESGSGKSVAALSFPNSYTLDFDRKMPAISQKHFPRKETFWDTFDDVFLLSNRIEELVNDCPYETLIADSLTSLSTLALKSVADVRGESIIQLLANIRKNKALASNKEKYAEKMSIDYYDNENKFFIYFLDIMKALWAREGNPKNILMTAHVVTTESAPDLKTKLITRTRTIVTAGRKVGTYIPTQFDDAWHFAFERPELGSDGPVRHIVYTESAGEDFAKTAYRLPARIDFTGGSLYDKIQEYLKPRESSL